LAVIGCTQQPATNQHVAAPAPAKNVDGSKYVLNAEPEGAQEVIEVREATKDGDDVLIVGRIGGGENPWIDGRAAFTIVDNSLKACSDIPGDGCKTPWDYCCETDKLKTGTALVKVVDDNGNVVKAGAEDLLNVQELSTVVVKGKAQRDDDGNLIVLAQGVFVKKK
jgi:hypothetical protein